MRLLRILGVTLPVLAAIAACSDSGSSDEPRAEAGVPDSGGEGGPDPNADGTVSGSVQKGPFGLGSTVSISELDNKANPTGRVFNTQTKDALGSFAVANVPKGDYSLAASGFYFNEIMGKLSAAPITLRSLQRVGQAATTTCVNLVTHLAYGRTENLVRGGMDVVVATAQAETELRTSLAFAAVLGTLPPASTSDLLGGDTDPNAYVFAVSVVFLEAARKAASVDGSSVDAALDQLLAAASTDLAPDGTLSPDLVARLRAAEQNLSTDGAEFALASYLSKLGSNTPLPDLDRIIDSDGDGIVNAKDNCPFVANPNQQLLPGVTCLMRRVETPLVGNANGNITIVQLTLADFDEDGKLDVLPLGSSQYGILLGDGTGHFKQKPVGVTLPENALRLFARDVDGDGHLDLVMDTAVDDGGTGASCYFPGDGKGGFGARRILDPGAGPGRAYSAIAVEDFDGDKVQDLVVVDKQAGLGFRKGLGKGNFAAPVAIPGVPGAFTIQQSRDLDGDGKPDLLVTPLNAAVFLHGNGDGTFTQAAAATDVGAILDVGDIDMNGKNDLIVIGGTARDIIAYAYADGAGGYGTRATVTPIAWPFRPTAAGTFLSPTKTDFFMYVKPTTTWQLVYVAGGSGPFTLQNIPPQGRTTYDIGAMVAGDLDGNGRPDLVYSDRDPATGRELIVGTIIK